LVVGGEQGQEQVVELVSPIPELVVMVKALRITAAVMPTPWDLVVRM
jgi:hypothetical protein